LEDEGDKNWVQRNQFTTQAGGKPSESYRVYLSDSKTGFEFGEHLLSKQLLFIFSGLPPLDLAGKLEAIGFDHSADERMFTLEANEITRQKTYDVAAQFLGASRGNLR
jgi:hypothetical protein